MKNKHLQDLKEAAYYDRWLQAWIFNRMLYDICLLLISVAGILLSLFFKKLTLISFFEIVYFSVTCTAILITFRVNTHYISSFLNEPSNDTSVNKLELKLTRLKGYATLPFIAGALLIFLDQLGKLLGSL